MTANHGESPTEKFLADLEEQIVQRLHAEASTQEGRAKLIRSTGVHDPKLLDELGNIGITADAFIALRLFPLVLTAWAEDNADVGEQETVMAEASKLGIREGSTAWLMLDHWMRKPPPGQGVDAWKRYIHEFFGKMSKFAQRQLIELTEEQMTSVAKASGGRFGIGKVSKKERAIIRQVTFVMRQQMLMP